MKKLLLITIFLLLSVNCFSKELPVKFEVEKSYLTILDKFEYIRIYDIHIQELLILNRREPTIDLNRLSNGQYRLETNTGVLYFTIKGDIFCILTSKK